MAISMFTSLNV